MNKWLIFVMIGIVFVVLSAMKYYVYARFIRPSEIVPNYLGIAFLVALGIGEIIFFAIRSANLSHLQFIIIASCVVFTYSIFMATLCVDIIKALYHLWSSKAQAIAIADSTLLESRRRFLKIIFDLGIIALFFIFSIKSFSNALSIPPVKRVGIKLDKLESSKRIAMITDVHIGRMLGRAFLEQIVAQINALNVDMVVIVGDLVDENIEYIKDDLAPLKNLQSKEGVYYVAGNHEYYHGIEPILAHLSTLNLQILHNTSVELAHLNIAGVSDLAGDLFNNIKPDLNAAKARLNYAKPSILLSHQPKFVRQNDVSDFDLVLCGHTHAGQVFPLSIFVWLDQHYIHGLYTLPRTNGAKQTKLYVSSGVGFWGPAIRFLAPSEIVLLELEA